MLNALFVLLLASGNTPIKLTAVAPEGPVLVGEPLALILSWSAEKAGHLPSPGQEGRHLRFDVMGPIETDPTRRGKYQEEQRDGGETPDVLVRVAAGRSGDWSVDVVLGAFEDGGISPLFTVAGTYEVTVTLAMPTEPAIVAEPIRIEVVSPKEGSRDAEVLKWLRADWRRLYRLDPETRNFVKRFSESNYFLWRRAEEFERVSRALSGGYDPESGIYLAGMEPPERERRTTLSEALLEDAERRDWGGFGDRVLYKAVALAGQFGDRARKARLEEKLEREFPRSVLTAKVREKQ